MTRRLPIRVALSALLAFALPTPLARPLLNLLGHRIGPGCRIGWSVLCCDFIGLEAGARVGHFNIVAVRRLVLRGRALLGRSNVIHGPLNVVLHTEATLGNRNRILRVRAGVSYGPAQLLLKHQAKITAGHHVDCTQSVCFGKFSHLAGAGSQVWTHGYVHELTGPGRYRIDGKVIVEDNVYVGAACVVTMGVRLVAGVIVGAGTAVSRSLLEPGLYVAAPMRVLGRPAAPETRDNLHRVTDPTVCETIFLKRSP